MLSGGQEQETSGASGQARSRQSLASPKALERFFKKVKFQESGCWEWTGSKIHHGYGEFRTQEESLAHRVSYTVFKGEIPAGLVLDHLCRNTSCVNPEHLEAVTQKVNIQRGRRGFSERTHCSAGHEFTPQNTYLRPGGGRQCRICKRAKKQEYMAKNKQGMA